ncbi:MAG: ABC transporter permease [Planctomycetes bacterium]|nr:ABC transporter permease [Planctomycetota bacterium]
MKLLELSREAWTNLLLHKTRSSLAALGVIFGVASVICMLSISEVARRDVIGRIERLGIRNVILDSVKPERVRTREKHDSDRSWIARYGLTREDLEVLADNVPEIETIVPMRIMLEDVQANLEVSDINVVATTPAYTRVMSHAVREGRFLSEVDNARSQPVCVLGADAAQRLFPLASPLGQVVRIGGHHFKVVGVLERKGPTGTAGILSNPDNTAWMPMNTSFSRFGKLQVRRRGGSSEATEVEINRAVVRVREGLPLEPVAAIARNLAKRRHKQDDVAVTIPYALLKERRQAERIFRWVMGSLAAISLLVGGVGIMNIMLANMAERRHEIGLRRALGATRNDILRLFVSESTLLCCLGGVLGVGLGALLAQLVGTLAQWTVVFQPLSFPLGIVVSVLTGLIFGTLPAIKAARLDPVLALRVE